MKQEGFLTIKEAAQELGITEQEVIDLAEAGKISAYKIGGVYLRFKPEHVQEAKQNISQPTISQPNISQPTQDKVKVSLGEKIEDFFYFNDFYILALLIIILMLIIILRI